MDDLCHMVVDKAVRPVVQPPRKVQFPFCFERSFERRTGQAR